MTSADWLPTLLQPPYLGAIGHGLLTTLELTVTFVIVGGTAGFAMALLRAALPRWLEPLLAAWVACHRNIPMVVQMLFWYFAMPQILPDRITGPINASASEFVYAALALSSAFAAYVSEDLRSGIRSLPPGQYLAARASGLGFVASMVFVVLPQAVRAATPAICNQILLFFKGTSLAAAIGVAELTHVAQEINHETFLTFQIFAIATALYMAVALGLIGLVNLTEARFGGSAGRRSRRRRSTAK
ncbi:amino acid ABC transporter permease [Siculibacillus lacustris]|uniref:Amino acid ABC transporter permease n=1 Tax=Siculibacillus lacustris TaxID=1549641 RepID=A0A4Q9VXQ9_9HYPH|nr:amino acid ABC transporter permease [Siculibacillus lacustris]TBW41277.1 amino acid ABC transporter permease [Siculibacillus lacustris]